MKIALLIDEYFGGANTAFGGYGFLARYYIAKYINGHDIELNVILGQSRKIHEVEENIVDNVKIYRLPAKSNIIKNWLRKQNYDLFCSIELTNPSYKILRYVKHKNLLLWIQDPRPESVWKKIRETMSLALDPCIVDSRVPRLIRKLYRQNRVKFISQGISLIPLAEKLYNVNLTQNTKVVRNPINIDYNFKFDLKAKKQQVIFLGRLEPQKRAWIFCEIAKNLPQYEFIVLGRFFRDEEKNKKLLENYIDNGINNLHFKGLVEGDEKMKIIKESRLLINTSIWEGIPISWLEALQYGTLIVSDLNNENLPSNFGKFIGTFNGDGFDSVDKFCKEIVEMMTDDSLYESKALQAIDYVRANHGVETFINSFKQAINETLELKPRDSFIQKLKRSIISIFKYA